MEKKKNNKKDPSQIFFLKKIRLIYFSNNIGKNK